MDITLWLELIVFVVLMAFSGFFSSSETALFSLSSMHLEQMRRDGNAHIDRVQRLLGEPRRLIITILIGNELVNVAASVISAAVIIRFLGSDSKWMNLLVMVPILLLVGEIAPKTLAIRNNKAFATVQCRPIAAFSTLITPLRWIVRIVADWFITMIVGRERSRGNIITEDMVRTLAHEAVGEGALDRYEAQFIDHIFDFGAKSVGELMTPRSDVIFLAVDTPLAAVVEDLRRTWVTKVPVYEGNRDNVLGVLHARDLLAHGLDIGDRRLAQMRHVLREAYFVPESKQAADLFADFRKRKQSIALIVDEYGGVTGLVTMEDLLECIFGDIASPSDRRREVGVEDEGGGRWTSNGSIRVADFNHRTGCNLSVDGAETIGGLLLHEHGELPSTGEVIETGGVRFEILEVADNRVKRFAWMVDGAAGNGEAPADG